MDNNKKQPYLAPAVMVVEVKVERGFTLSGGNAPVNPGDAMMYQRHNVNSGWLDELTSTGEGMNYTRQNVGWLDD